jgi:hypothetical protein
MVLFGTCWIILLEYPEAHAHKPNCRVWGQRQRLCQLAVHPPAQQRMQTGEIGNNLSRVAKGPARIHLMTEYHAHCMGSLESRLARAIQRSTQPPSGDIDSPTHAINTRLKTLTGFQRIVKPRPLSISAASSAGTHPALSKSWCFVRTAFCAAAVRHFSCAFRRFTAFTYSGTRTDASLRLSAMFNMWGILNFIRGCSRCSLRLESPVAAME